MCVSVFTDNSSDTCLEAASNASTLACSYSIAAGWATAGACSSVAWPLVLVVNRRDGWLIPPLLVLITLWACSGRGPL